MDTGTKVEKLKNIKMLLTLNRDRLRFLLFCNGIENWEKYKFTKSNENIIQKNVLKYGNRLF